MEDELIEIDEVVEIIEVIPTLGEGLPNVIEVQPIPRGRNRDRDRTASTEVSTSTEVPSMIDEDAVTKNDILLLSVLGVIGIVVLVVLLTGIKRIGNWVTTHFKKVKIGIVELEAKDIKEVK